MRENPAFSFDSPLDAGLAQPTQAKGAKCPFPLPASSITAFRLLNRLPR
jgi:hypothetical protein